MMSRLFLALVPLFYLISLVEGAYYLAYYDNACLQQDDFESYPVNFFTNVGASALVATVQESPNGSFSNGTFIYPYTSTGAVWCTLASNGNHVFTELTWPNATGNNVSQTLIGTHGVGTNGVTTPAVALNLSYTITPYAFLNGSAVPDVCSPFIFCESRFVSTVASPYPGLNCFTGYIRVNCGSALGPPVSSSGAGSSGSIVYGNGSSSLGYSSGSIIYGNGSSGVGYSSSASIIYGNGTSSTGYNAANGRYQTTAVYLTIALMFLSSLFLLA